jgi:hypothetical protein
MRSVVENHFNFENVADEVHAHALVLGLTKHTESPYDEEKCRIRWSYLHLQRKLGKTVSYRAWRPEDVQQNSERSGSEAEEAAAAGFCQENKENAQTYNMEARAWMPNKQKKKAEARAKRPQTAKMLFAKKDFSIVTKKDWKHVDDIEADLWKTNIRDGPRAKRDFLDVGAEDFSKNKSLGLDGKEITPSPFNVMRDSLADVSAQLLETLQ